MLTTNDIKAAEKRIRPYIHETPLEKSWYLSQEYDTNVFLKCEHLQKTGSFKLRGALNKVLCLSELEKERGIIAASTGNHGQAVAWASGNFGIKATIYVPHDVSPIKARAIEPFGAEIKTCEGDCLDAEFQARQEALENNMTFISPYNDTDVVAGQGTIVLELAQQYEKLDAVFISVGGGGLISGVATYLKSINPNIKIIGCWPENSPVMYEHLKAGNMSTVKEEEKISDGTAGALEPGTVTFPLCQDLIDDSILVSEKEIKNAMCLLADYERMIVEGAAGVALACFIKEAEQFKDKNVAVILCGRNIALNKFIGAVS